MKYFVYSWFVTFPNFLFHIEFALDSIFTHHIDAGSREELEIRREVWGIVGKQKYFAYSRFKLFIYSEVWSHFEWMYFFSLRKWFSLLSTLLQILWSIDVRILVWSIVREQDYDSTIMIVLWLEVFRFRKSFSDTTLVDYGIGL